MSKAADARDYLADDLDEEAEDHAADDDAYKRSRAICGICPRPTRSMRRCGDVVGEE